MSDTTGHDPLFWVITESEEAHGPYPDWESAYIFASINLGPDGWTITET